MIYRLRDSNDGRRTIAFAVEVCMAVRETGRNEVERPMNVVYFIFAGLDSFHYTKVDNYRATQSLDNGHLKCEKFMEYILRKAFITAETGLPSNMIFQNQSSTGFGHTRFRILLQGNA